LLDATAGGVASKKPIKPGGFLVAQKRPSVAEKGDGPMAQGGRVSADHKTID